MFQKNFFNLLQKILKIQFEIKLPKKNKILIFDKEGSEALKKTLGLKSFEILHVRNEKINLSVAFLLAIKLKLNYVNYYLKIIEITNPKLVITFIDNNPNFYRLKNFFKEKIFISVQNGHRMAWGDIFGKLESLKKKSYLSADYIVTFNRNVSKKYKEYIKCETLNYGSLKNNYVPIKKSPLIKKNSLLYISAFRNHLWDIQNKTISPDEYEKRFDKQYKYKLERHIHFELPKILENFCKNNNMKLSILGMSNSNKEIIFYKNILKYKFYFIKKKNLLSNYHKLQNYNLTVSSVSTLGYEALARNSKICFISPNISKKEASYKFGWPYVKNSNDFFFTNNFNEKKIEKILINLKNMNNSIWNKKITKYKKNLMDFDYKNSQLKKRIYDILN
jgi:surface carbohydrate biosynthesis protein